MKVFVMRLSERIKKIVERIERIMGHRTLRVYSKGQGWRATTTAATASEIATVAVQSRQAQGMIEV